MTTRPLFFNINNDLCVIIPTFSVKQYSKGKLEKITQVATAHDGFIKQIQGDRLGFFIKREHQAEMIEALTDLNYLQSDLYSSHYVISTCSNDLADNHSFVTLNEAIWLAEQLSSYPNENFSTESFGIGIFGCNSGLKVKTPLDIALVKQSEGYHLFLINTPSPYQRTKAYLAQNLDQSLLPDIINTLISYHSLHQKEGESLFELYERFGSQIFNHILQETVHHTLLVSNKKIASPVIPPSKTITSFKSDEVCPTPSSDQIKKWQHEIGIGYSTEKNTYEPPLLLNEPKKEEIKLVVAERKEISLTKEQQTTLFAVDRILRRKKSNKNNQKQQTIPLGPIQKPDHIPEKIPFANLKNIPKMPKTPKSPESKKSVEGLANLTNDQTQKKQQKPVVIIPSWQKLIPPIPKEEPRPIISNGELFDEFKDLMSEQVVIMEYLIKWQEEYLTEMDQITFKSVLQDKLRTLRHTLLTIQSDKDNPGVNFNHFLRSILKNYIDEYRGHREDGNFVNDPYEQDQVYVSIKTALMCGFIITELLKSTDGVSYSNMDCNIKLQSFYYPQNQKYPFRIQMQTNPLCHLPKLISHKMRSMPAFNSSNIWSVRASKVR